MALQLSVYAYLALEGGGSAWVNLSADVLPDDVRWERGLPGAGPTDLVANSGIGTIFLDNSHSNSDELPGKYSPDHANALFGFELGVPVVICLEDV